MKRILRGIWFGFNARALPNWLGLALFGALLAGCSGDKVEKIVILGSNTVGEELMPRLVAEYRKDHPNITFEMDFKGTTYGLGALMVSRCDIAAASREVTTNELALAKDRKIEFSDHVIGAYDVAVVVNAASPLSNLTREQVRDLFTGVTQNWKDVGGPDAPVRLCIRHPISGTYLGFRELAMENKPYSLNVKTYTNYTELVEAVAKDPSAIGYSTIRLSGAAGVKPVSINGVAPATDAVNKGQYPYARFLRLYTDKDGESEAAKDFVDFVESSRGQEILDQMGYLRHP